MLCVAFAWKGRKIGIEKVFFYRYLCLKIILGENIYKFIIILFTRKDDLDEEKKKICMNISRILHQNYDDSSIDAVDDALHLTTDLKITS